MLKFRWICSRDYGVMGVLSLGVWLPSNFQRPLAAKLCQTPKSFRGARTCSGYHHAKFGGAWISLAARVAKNVEFLQRAALQALY